MNRNHQLNYQEKQCLYWAGQDRTLHETAEALRLSPETVKRYRKLILDKLNCRTMTGALALALKRGIL